MRDTRPTLNSNTDRTTRDHLNGPEIHYDRAAIEVETFFWFAARECMVNFTSLGDG